MTFREQREDVPVQISSPSAHAPWQSQASVPDKKGSWFAGWTLAYPKGCRESSWSLATLLN